VVVEVGITHLREKMEDLVVAVVIGTELLIMLVALVILHPYRQAKEITEEQGSFNPEAAEAVLVQ